MVTDKNCRTFEGTLLVNVNSISIIDKPGSYVTIPVDSIQQIRFINGITNSFRIITGTTFTIGGCLTMFDGLLRSGVDNTLNGPGNYYSHPTSPLNQDRTIEFVGLGFFTAGIIMLLSHRKYELQKWDFVIRRTKNSGV